METSHFKILIIFISGFTCFSLVKAGTVDILHQQGKEMDKVEESTAFYEEGMSLYKMSEYLSAEKAFLKSIDIAAKKK